MKKFNLLGYEIEADSNLEKYSNIKNCYCEIASGMSDAFDEFWDDYLNSSFFDDIVRKYESLMRTQYQSYASAQREYEYNSTASHRWSASGFGINGAIAGAIRAGAMNFAGDVVAGFNAVRNYEKQVERMDSFYAEKFDELYTEQLYTKIKIGIWNLSMYGMCAYMEELEEHGMFEYPDIDRENADIIYNNTYYC